MVSESDAPDGHLFGGAYRDKKVLLTGHTGFKGSWMAEWLLTLGAKVTGVSVDVPTNPSLFDQLGLGSRLHDLRADVRNLDQMTEIIRTEQPDFIFHLAAQSLVRTSYERPVLTFETNLMGSVNVMEAVRNSGRRCVLVMITTDKCYENREWLHAYREEDPMGGHDPYSASKGCAEIAISAYRRSFFSTDSRALRVALASARAGNVIGGGDWAVNRIVPDSIRALEAGLTIPVRNKDATRPWQHVLEPLSGYLLLGAKLQDVLNTPDPSVETTTSGQLCSAFNFGPLLDSNRTVSELVQEITNLWKGKWEDRSDATAPHEAGRLNLAIDKAIHLLKWSPVWTFEQTVHHTVTWYQAALAISSGGSRELIDLTRNQISTYCDQARRANLPWALK